MAAINTYGLPVNLESLTAAAASTVNWERNSGWRTDIFYDRETGDVHTADLLGDSWKKFRDPAIIKVASTTRHHSEQWIMDAIHDEIDNLKNAAASLGETYTDTWQ